MKKLYLGIFLVLGIGAFSFNSYGIQNLKINNSVALTVTTADTIHITGNVESNRASAKAVLYYDTNENGIIDGNEKWILKFRLTDGNFDDSDETKNGVINITRKPFIITGKFVLCVEDSGVSDTIPIQVNPISSAYCSVSGTVVPNTSNIFIGIIDTIYNEEVIYGAFTDSTGAYSIYLPEIFKDSVATIFAMDVVNAVSRNYISSPIGYSSLVVLETVVKNFELNNLTDDTTFVSGTVRDDAGNPIADPVQILGGVFGSQMFITYTTTDFGGYYNYIMKKTGPAYYYTEAAYTSEQFYPQYLTALPKLCLFMYSPATIITNNITLYRATDSICGTVYKDSVPFRGAQIDIGIVSPADSVLTEGTYTKTYSDGHYTAYVSDVITTYSVKVALKSIPKGYEVKEGDTVTASPGSAAVNFHLIKTSVEENPEVNIKYLNIRPNPFIQKTIIRYSLIGVHNNYKIDNSKIMIYDISGNKIMELISEYSKNENSYSVLLPNNKKMPAGIYFLKIGDFKPMKLIKLK